MMILEAELKVYADNFQLIKQKLLKMGAKFIEDREELDIYYSHPVRDFKVTDDLSGIKSYTGYIDNEWVLFEYDPKSDKIFYTFDEKRLDYGKNHELELYIIDNKDNAASYFLMFYK